jgi:hypothetical protein
VPVSAVVTIDSPLPALTLAGIWPHCGASAAPAPVMESNAAHVPPRPRDCRACGHSGRVRFVTGCRMLGAGLPRRADMHASSLAAG